MATDRKKAKHKPAPRRRDPDAKAAFRDEVVAIARELFVEQGYDAVSFRALAARTGCTPMALYGYFPSKLALLRYIWADIFRELFAATEAELRKPTTPPRKIKAYCRAWVNYWLEHPDNYRVVFLNQDLGTEEPRPDLEGSDQAFFADGELARSHLLLLMDVIDTGIRKGHLKAMDPLMQLQIVFSQLLGLVHGLITIPEFGWSAELVETSVEVLLAGLSPD